MAKPRKLRLLRIDDDARKLPKSMPIEYMGCISEWVKFAEGLQGGNYGIAMDDNVEYVSVRARPDILAVDFRFDKDGSVPGKEELQGQIIKDWAEDVLPSGRRDKHPLSGFCEWAPMLQTPNTGVLIGATLTGVSHDWDWPMISCLHTGTSADTIRDMSTLLLVGQMLSVEGTTFESEDILTETFRRFATLEPDCHNAVVVAMGRYRKKLKDQLGVGTNGRSPRLWVNPDSLLNLLGLFDRAENAQKLDKELDKHGLEMWGRDGVAESIHVRSLFMDLGHELGTRVWKPIPLEYFKLVSEDKPGEVLEFVQELSKELGDHYRKSAEIVYGNRTSTRKKRISSKISNAAQLAGVVFAVVEAAIQRTNDYESKLFLPWDPIADTISENETMPTLNGCMIALGRIMARAEDYVDHISEDGFIPVRGSRKGKKKRSGLIQIMKEYTDHYMPDNYATYEEDFNVILRLFSVRQSQSVDGGTLKQMISLPKRVDVLTKLLAYMGRAGMVEIRVEQEDYRLLTSRLELPRSFSDEKDFRHMVSDLLSFPKASKPSKSRDNTNQYMRILTRNGYEDYKPFLNSLLDLQMPPHLAQLATWYVDTYHDDIPAEKRPRCCKI